MSLDIDNLYDLISDLVDQHGYSLIPQSYDKGLAIVDDETMEIILIKVSKAYLEVIT